MQLKTLRFKVRLRRMSKSIVGLPSLRMQVYLHQPIVTWHCLSDWLSLL